MTASRVVAHYLSVNWQAQKLYQLSCRTRSGSLTHVLLWLCRVLTGVEIGPGVVIGERLKIVHGNGLVVGMAVVIGDDCTLHHQVTLGINGAPGDSGMPRLGNRVTVYPGAKVLGGILIGNDAVIGANAVVLADVPPGAVMVGVPARNVAPLPTKE